jgi:hypothetical protein
MSYPRNMAGAVALLASMAGAVALLASSSLLGLGCMVGADGQSKDTDEQSMVTDDVSTLDTAAQTEESADAVASEDGTEVTGESKDAFGYYGFGYPFYGRRFYGGFGYPFYGRRFYGGFGYPFSGFGGYGYPFFGGYGYPFSGYGFGGCRYGFC